MPCHHKAGWQRMGVGAQSTSRDIKQAAAAITQKMVVVTIGAAPTLVAVWCSWKRNRHNLAVFVQAAQ